jgi:uncharacterized membrane protein YccC
VLVSKISSVDHSFWVVLGALSVLRSNALNTGQTIVRGLVGTIVGFVIGALVVVVVGTDTTLLWFLLPPAVLLAGLAPATISFAAGQAAFTLTLLILFNILQPEGWQIGLVRVEDVALGCAVSLVVGLLFWPRGAAAALGQALAQAYAQSARYLARTVEFGMGRCDDSGLESAAPTEDAAAAAAAAAASRRLDDTFRTPDRGGQQRSAQRERPGNGDRSADDLDRRSPRRRAPLAVATGPAGPGSGREALTIHRGRGGRPTPASRCGELVKRRWPWNQPGPRGSRSPRRTGSR